MIRRSAQDILGFIFANCVQLAPHVRVVLAPSERSHGQVVPCLTWAKEETGRALMAAAAMDSHAPDMIVNHLRWGEFGFQVLEPTTELATSLMATEVRGIVPMPPWPTFAVKLPRGTLTTEGAGGNEDLLVALINIERSGNRRVRIDIHGSQAVLHSCYETIDDLVEKVLVDTIERPAGPLESDLDDADRRSQMLVARLAVGLMLELEARPAGSSTCLARAKRFCMRRGAATSSHWALTRPVKVNCADAVREFARFGGSAPTVRTMVRGHWRNQPHGPRNTLRKLIHVEPFWRGPEDAPIPLRPHVMGAIASQEHR